MAKKTAKVVSRPAVPPPIRIRKNVAKLKDDDPIIVYYGKAIEAMSFPHEKFTSPLSWRYQAAIHDYVDADEPLSAADQKKDPPPGDQSFWRQCQHFSWYFLPWHRMYLYFFERILMSKIEKLGGPTDWALPYWNYTASDGAGKIPVPFRNEKMPDKSRNWLYVSQRDPKANDGKVFVTPDKRSATDALSKGKFEAKEDDDGFGGEKTGFNHDSGDLNGFLEDTPHGSMHVAVSGPSPDGFMGSFTRAPLDPIFWLHHCNIDRLWDVWLQDKSHKNPADWLDAKKDKSDEFSFHDEKKAVRKMRSSAVLDTKKLFYVYDDITAP